ncbi:Olfactory receptor class A-like protein 4 [Ameca splendens]|uniref:Olfactory receptor class A-like protein 4 n=1 Tax=Ameca splendens TaxID=208324 RepID=A0ABV0YYU3_9TELE
MDKHVSTERKAAHVIISLVSLFVVCWVLQVAAVTYYNHDGGYHTEGLLNVAQFSASLFVGFSPLVVALGHGKLRRKIKSMILVWTKVPNSQETGRGKKSPKTKGKQTNFVAQKEMRVIKVKDKVKSQR